MRRSSLFIVLLLGGCIIPIRAPGCSEEPIPACHVGAKEGCGPDQICTLGGGFFICADRCASTSECNTEEECAPAAEGSGVTLCLPCDPVVGCKSGSGSGSGGADPGEDLMLDAGINGLGGDGGSFGTGGPIVGDAWPQFGHDAKHTGRSSAVPSHAPTLLWKCDLPGSSGWADLVIDADRNLYASDNLHVYAIDPVGKLRWQAGNGALGVVVAPSGDLVWTEQGGNVHGAKADGTGTFDRKFQGPGGWVGISRPTLGAAGIVYVTTLGIVGSESALHAIDPAGVLLWSQTLSTDGHSPGQPAQDDDGSLVVTLRPSAGAAGNALVKITSAGAVVWSRPLPDEKVNPGVPTFGPSGSIRAAIGSSVVGFTAAGDPGFTTTLVVGLVAPLTPIDEQGISHVGHSNGLAGINSIGSLLWSKLLGAGDDFVDFAVAPALTADGVLVVRQAGGRLYGAHHGKAVWTAEATTGAGAGLSVIIGPDATLYTASGPTVFALR